MTDVIKPAHSSNSTVKNGAVVAGAQSTGKYERNDPQITSLPIPSGEIQTRYDNRFDDVRYYTGDNPT